LATFGLDGCEHIFFCKQITQTGRQTVIN